MECVEAFSESSYKLELEKFYSFKEYRDDCARDECAWDDNN
jgi:hypothetical protein